MKKKHIKEELMFVNEANAHIQKEMQELFTLIKEKDSEIEQLTDSLFESKNENDNLTLVIADKIFKEEKEKYFKGFGNSIEIVSLKYEVEQLKKNKI